MSSLNWKMLSFSETMQMFMIVPVLILKAFDLSDASLTYVT
jgi:hypothetical protein